MAMSVYDEGDIVIISWARINQSLGDEPCNLSSIALQILNVLKYLHWSNFLNKISIYQKYVQQVCNSFENTNVSHKKINFSM